MIRALKIPDKTSDAKTGPDKLNGVHDRFYGRFALPVLRSLNWSGYWAYVGGMKLDVVKAEAVDKPWYADGLRFTCSQCGNCCTGGPGFVWLAEVEVTRLADHLRLSVEETIERYCRRVGGRVSLKETLSPAGLHDCVFLEEHKEKGPDGVTQTRRTCGIYPVRPLQCRTWPFWDGNLSDPAIWENSAKRCHGMNQGRSFSRREMEALRDAEEWPENPPTS
jgi:Fe-S-cluster containining protein